MMVKVKHCTVELVFDIWDDEVEVAEVPAIIAHAIDRAGYSVAKDPTVVTVTEATMVLDEE